MEIENILYKFRSEIEVIFKNGKSLKISGEWTTTPAFYADSFDKWEKPFQEEIIESKFKKIL
ncbi:hypothetical protein M8845_13630 [Gelidibacter japonicus]|jgi:hypothetical protein|uniref:hypothetical protein n=1 Tax=Gelidibacter japonicus TaxID=1962232 RepID=UPI00201FBA04|nr:hypothetical protein [Gelidibacter japonicus]MCL8008465.1 hypothetical protein [Gelidibacter japonicus]